MEMTKHGDVLYHDLFQKCEIGIIFVWGRHEDTSPDTYIGININYERIASCAGISTIHDYMWKTSTPVYKHLKNIFTLK